MKCVQYTKADVKFNIEAGEILRLRNETAAKEVKAGRAQYTNKQAWKKQKRALADAAKAA